MRFIDRADEMRRLDAALTEPGALAVIRGRRRWRRHRARLEAQAWEELCRMAVPFLHRSASPLADLGPWEPAQRYWRRNEPAEFLRRTAAVR